MSTASMALIVLAGFAAGAINSVVGSGTLITFPTLVALGLPPVTATMSNAVGMVPGGLTGTWGYRAELTGQWQRLRWQIPVLVVGAAIGAFLLLHLPEKVFIRIVPALLLVALILVVLGPRIQAYARRRADAAGRSVDQISPRRMAALSAGTFLIGIYGGYFTAAQGILLVGLMGALLPDDLQRMNAAKNLMSLLINVVAATGFIVVASGRINWLVVGLIATGSMLGGWVGARYGRRLSPTALRIIIVVVGLIGLYRLMAL